MRSLLVDRRGKIRFELARPLRYRVLKRSFLHTVATGRAVDVSSKGVLFEAENELRMGDPLELLIDWPVCLNDRVPLQLVMAGRVVRVDGNRCAAAVERYEFRTRAANSPRLNAAAAAARSAPNAAVQNGPSPHAA
jgi:hypothetical protein